MKVYLNSPCPCGSGKIYKECCMQKRIDQVGIIGSLPIDRVDENMDFIVNRAGAVVFKNESKQPVLEIPEGFIVKNVLSVGFNVFEGKRKPTVTIQESKGVICYILPDQYLGWCLTCVGMAQYNRNVFPSNVKFSRIGDKYFADIL